MATAAAVRRRAPRSPSGRGAAAPVASVSTRTSADAAPSAAADARTVAAVGRAAGRTPSGRTTPRTIATVRSSRRTRSSSPPAAPVARVMSSRMRRRASRATRRWGAKYVKVARWTMPSKRGAALVTRRGASLCVADILWESAGTNVPAARRGRLRANRGRLRAKRETSAPAPQGVGNGFTMVNNGAAGSAAGPGPRKGAGELRGLVGARRSPSAQLQARCDPALLSSHAEADRTYG